MKISLINPPAGKYVDDFTRKHVFPPLGLAYLASVLEQNEFEVEIYDAFVEGYSFNQLEKKITQSNPDVIGIGFTTETRFEGFETAKIFKKALPDSIVIGGGPHPSLATEDTLLNIPEIDIIIRGEGEYSLLELCNMLKKRESFASVKGISFRNGDKVVHNPPRPHIQNLDDIPFPARHLLPMDKYNGVLDVEDEDIPAESIMTSRGCPIKCNFCATSKLWGAVIRSRYPSNVVAELENIVKIYGKKNFWFFDDTFTMDPARAGKVCDKIIEQRLDIRWVAQVRVDTLNRELVKKMKTAGCIQIRFGVESGSQRILDNIVKKRITIEQVKQVAKWCNELGLIGHASFIINHPEEEIEDVRKTMSLIHELCDKNITTKLLPMKIYPGTKIEEIAREKRILPNDFSWTEGYKHETPHLSSVVGNAPLFFDKLSWRQTSEFLFEWAEMQGYSPLKNIPQALKSIRSFNDLERLSSMGKTYFKQRFIKPLNDTFQSMTNKVLRGK
jgi:radical SAM superfamily enzyme YgiQ (UPF0313 family)